MAGQDRQKKKAGATTQANQAATEAARFKGRDFYNTMFLLNWN
jgi:hypothetical protein